jgi:hypothetical protein
MDELAKHVQKNFGAVMLNGSDQLMQLMRSELKKLEGYLKEEIEAYKASYQPKVYVRTGNWENSIRLNEPYIEGNTIVAKIDFDEDLANHPSVIGSDQPDGFVPWLLETGWDINDKVQPRRPMFTDHPGTHYIKKAVDRFNAENRFWLKVNVYYNGVKYV